MTQYKINLFPIDSLKRLTLNEIMTDEMRRVIILLETGKNDIPLTDTNRNSSRYSLNKILH
jgi:hypothetical protein